jgi:hypothetical protein
LSCFAEALSLQRSSGSLPSEHAGLLAVAGFVLPEGSCSVMDEREIICIISRAILQMYLLRQAERDLVCISKPESRERAVARLQLRCCGEVRSLVVPSPRGGATVYHHQQQQEASPHLDSNPGTRTAQSYGSIKCYIPSSLAICVSKAGEVMGSSNTHSMHSSQR